MSTSRQDEWLVALVRDAIESAPVPAEGHWVDDEETLTCFVEGLVGDSQREILIAHLADCSRCRQRLAEFVREGATDAGQAEPPQPIVRSWWFTRPVAAPLALAASLLLALAGWWFITRDAGDRDAANDREPFDKKADADEQAMVLAALEKSVFEQGTVALRQGDFAEVERLENLARREGARSARLANLRLQAQLAMPAARSLEIKGFLTAYGYDITGGVVRDRVPISSATARVAEEQFSQAVLDYPDDVDLRLNFGQFLMRLKRTQKAREQFLEAVRIDPDHLLARLGLGLADYVDQRFQEALEHFEFVIESEPKSAAALVNAAMCLDRLGRAAEAKEYWGRAETLAPEVVQRHPLAP